MKGVSQQFLIGAMAGDIFAPQGASGNGWRHFSLLQQEGGTGI